MFSGNPGYLVGKPVRAGLYLASSTSEVEAVIMEDNTLVSTFSAVVTTITSTDGGDGGEMEGIAQTVRPALVSHTVVLWLVSLF